jgi:preprotein translocase subunit YajC
MQAQPAGPDFGFFLMLTAIFGIFYFLVIRPQQKQQKQRESEIKAATSGDRVVTAGGLHGTITEVESEDFIVEIARIKGVPVKVKVARARVESVSRADGGDKGQEGSGS